MSKIKVDPSQEQQAIIEQLSALGIPYQVETQDDVIPNYRKGKKNIHGFFRYHCSGLIRNGNCAGSG